VPLLLLLPEDFFQFKMPLKFITLLGSSKEETSSVKVLKLDLLISLVLPIYSIISLNSLFLSMMELLVERMF